MILLVGRPAGPEGQSGAARHGHGARSEARSRARSGGDGAGAQRHAARSAIISSADRCSDACARCSTIAASRFAKCGPSMPAEVLGLESLPEVGDTLQVVTDTAKAKQIVIYRESQGARSGDVEDQSHHARTAPRSVEGRRGQGAEHHPQDRRRRHGRSADGYAAEAFERQGQDPRAARRRRRDHRNATCCWRRLRTRSSSASTSGRSAPRRPLAEQEKVDIRLHTIIYELADEIKRAMTGMLEPVFKEVYKGRAQVREVFRISKVGAVAGCMVQRRRDHAQQRSPPAARQRGGPYRQDRWRSSASRTTPAK